MSLSPTLEVATPSLRPVDFPPRLWVPCEGQPKPAGTRLARGESLTVESPPVPSPADARIAGTSRQTLLGGQEVQTAIVEPDRTPAPPPPGPPTMDQVRKMLDSLAPGDLPSQAFHLSANGIAAERWTGPSLAAQLADAERSPADVVLCGALDLDPVLPLQQSICASHAMEMATGVMALAKIVGAARGIIALPEESPEDVVAAMKEAAATTSVRLYPLRNEYPLAQPSLLIRRVLGRGLKPGRLPTEAHVLFIDAPAAAALGQFFLFREPMLTVPLGLYERGRDRTHLLRVAVGTRLSDVLIALEVPPHQSDLRAGQFLRDVGTTADAIIGPAELTVVASEPAMHPPAAACLRCGWCVEACPARIHPAGLLEGSQQQDIELGDRYGLQSCIECGICSYVCPSRLPLLRSIRLLREQ